MRYTTGAISHNIEKQRFELTVDGHTAVLDYRLVGNTIIFTHTGVPAAIENHGIGAKLVKAGLEYVSEKELKVRSFCWFVDKYIQKRPEYQHLMK